MKKACKLRFGAQLEIEGFNQTRLLNELCGAGVTLGDVERESAAKIRVFVPKKHLVKTFAILEKLCYTYAVKRRETFAELWRYLVKKSALILSVFVCAGLLVYAYGFVWRFDIAGCKKTEAAVIERLLIENGYAAGAKKAGLRPEEIRSLVNSLDDVLDTTVEISGITLKITVTETTDFTPPPSISTDGIYSRYDAQVTRVEANSGTPLVKPGSRIFAGAKLIGAYRTDQNGLEVPSVAQGNVYGTVTFGESTDFRLAETVTARTGRTSKKTDFSLWRFAMPAKAAQPFEKFESETVTAYAFENFFFPLLMTQTVYYELADAQAAFDLEERTEFYVNRAIAGYAALLGGSTFTVTTRLEQLQNSDAYRLHVFIQAELLLN